MEAKDKVLNLTRKRWLSKALATLPLLASALLLSCVDGQEEIATTSGEGEATVRLHISVGPIGDLNATRATDTNATEGELINSLCVFIVDSQGKIEAKIQPDLTTDTDAESGNLEEYTSDQITLTAGTKTIYAFSNWETADNSDWNDLINKSVGDEIGDLQILIDDPASCVDIEGGKYIPMSGSESATVSSGDLNTKQTVTVELIRLVGKLQVKVQLAEDSEEEVTVNSLTFSGTANSVWLFRDKTDSEMTIALGTDIEKKELNKTITSGSEDNTIATFYVNESSQSYESGQDGFGITLTSNAYNDEMTASSYTSTITSIDRNHIYVINLTLEALQLDISAQTSILGVDGEKPYNASAVQKEDNNYSIALYDVTSSFTITPTLTNNSNTITWEWTYTGSDSTEEEIKISKSSDGTLTVTQLTATPGHEYPFVLEASWNDGVAHSRTYNITVGFVDSSTAPELISEAPAKQGGEAAAPVIMKKRETFK